jgi:hypothetical protein
MVSRTVFVVIVGVTAALAFSARAEPRVSPVVVQARAQQQTAVDARATSNVLEWYRLVLNLVRHTATYSPPVASRTFGYLGVAVFEATAARRNTLRSLEGQLNNFKGVPKPAANLEYDDATILNGALSSVVAELFSNTGPTGQRALQAVTARLEKTVTDGINADVAKRSLEYGRGVAKAVLNWASTDGGAQITNLGFPLTYPKASSADAWVPTAALGMQQTPLLPGWGGNRPFALKTGNACPLPAPTAFSTEKDSAFYKEALEVYTVSKNLTQEQRDIAAFWDDSAMLSMTPPGHWVGILTQLFNDQPPTLERLAEGYARVGIAVADAFIGCWHTKFQYNLLRPVTYIQRVIDPKWTTLLITPPFPEYPSGHSTQSGAAATVLTAFFGENFAFTDRTHDDDGLEARSFKSFWDAANEAGISRMYGGIHYRNAITQGLEQGRCVGATVNALQFKR